MALSRVCRRTTPETAAPINAISKKTPAVARPPKTGPNSTDAHAYAATHKKTNIMRTAVAANVIATRKTRVTPVFDCTQRTTCFWMVLSIAPGSNVARGHVLLLRELIRREAVPQNDWKCFHDCFFGEKQNTAQLLGQLAQALFPVPAFLPPLDKSRVTERAAYALMLCAGDYEGPHSLCDCRLKSPA